MGAFSSKPVVVKKNKPEVTAIDRTVLDLKNARDRLQRYRKKLELDDAKLLQRAKTAKYNANNTQTAIGLLRLRKFKQRQATDCENQLLNVMQMVETIDSKQNEQVILDAMSAGKDALKQMHEETTVDHVLDLMDQIQEEHQVEQEITDILQGVPELSPVDEQAVEDELAALQAEMMAAVENGTKTNQDEGVLPVAPTHKLPTPTTPVMEQQQAETSSGRVAVPG